MPDHPHAHEELHKLTGTLDLVRQERAIAEQEKAHSFEALEAARADDPDAVTVREMLYESSLDAIRRLNCSRMTPYFTRVDFIPRGGALETHYIGRTGVLNTRTLEPIVIDWRAPIANLYYSGQLGEVGYEAPDGRVDGELRLKRQFTIRAGQLEAIFDTDLASRDQYLQSVLGATADGRLKEIISTIQAEQNYVIRHPLSASLIVQGVAGSGKTTIALHRIAYLLYAFERQLRPEQMLILAPNPLFLNFIAGVLPDLGVESVRQSTFPRLMREWLRHKLPPIDTRDRAAEAFALAPDEYERLRRVLQFKGSLDMDALLSAWLDGYERTFAKGSIAFGPVKLYDEAELAQFLLVDERPFPMERRLMEFKKQLTARAKSASRTMARWLEAESDKRLNRLIETERDPSALSTRRAQLIASRDERIREAKEQVAPFVKEVLSGMPTLEPAACYRLFLTSLLDGADMDAREAARYTLTRLDAGLLHEAEDIAPIACIAHRLTVLERNAVKHIVVDEAQDFSLMEFKLLSRYAPLSSMTVVGDLMQGILAVRGLSDWQALNDGVFDGRAVVHQLLTSYRSTLEIMQVALAVAARHPSPGQRGARPVLRHGKPAEFMAFDDIDAQTCLIAEAARAWRDEGLTSLAVIARSGATLKALLERLPEDLGARLLNVQSETFEPGLLLCEASAVKGFEFDGVIVADASKGVYLDKAPDARLLYVALTRALHRLTILYEGEKTPLLESAKN